LPFEIESDRPPCAALLAETLKAGGEAPSKMHRACCWGTGPQRCRPSSSDEIACTHRRPSARPSQTLPPATAPSATASAHSTQHHPCTAGVRNHPLTVKLAADACSVPLRPSNVSCGILPRLGASDAAPAPPIRLSARTAAPRSTPRKTPAHPLQPRAQLPQPTARSIIQCTAGVHNHALTAQLAADARSIQ
jgi:hypothetical protein